MRPRLTHHRQQGLGIALEDAGYIGSGQGEIPSPSAMSSNGNVSVSEIRNRACDRAARRSGSRIGNGRGQWSDTSRGHRPRYRLHIAATRPSRLRPLASIAKAHTPPMLLTIRTTSTITLSMAIIRSSPQSESGSLGHPCDRLCRRTGWQSSPCHRPPARPGPPGRQSSPWQP